MNRTIDDLDVLDYVDYLDEVRGITIFPNNCLDEVADELSDYGLTIYDVLANPNNYSSDDDVLWIKGKEFGSWQFWEMENYFGEDVLAWVESQEG